MHTLEVTDDQYAFIQHLRAEISADVVGKYGFVREQDAVQFLIDNLDEDVDIENEVESSATDDVAASVGAAIDGDPDPDHLEEVSYDEDSETDAPDGSGKDTDGETESGDDGETEHGDDGGDSGSDADDASDDGDAGADGENGDADDDEMLDEMMSLLETHDDKWDESSSSDHRYTVTLPDGSTEDVQTKDDVRALLFKNYR